MARGFAGEKGFLIVVDISDEIAGEHYSGDQIMAREGKPRPISNFVFSGKELARISKDGNANIIDLEIERRSKEGRADSLEVNPFRTIRGNDDLSEKDRSALEDIRRTISDGHEGKPPKA
ncbi:MAG: hypothetical protein ACD_50C00335G0001 [uncultured bacterium]|nr:MAG: hypothetical protein ACD_50C00335G0001 [uncultured bacterium]